MSAITKAAKHQQCTVRIPGVCCFNPETTVFAHISGVRFGHGMGIKTKLGAFACASCHDLIDSRMKRPEGMTKQDVKLMHYEGVFETLGKLIEMGLVVLS